MERQEARSIFEPEQNVPILLGPLVKSSTDSLREAGLIDGFNWQVVAGDRRASPPETWTIPFPGPPGWFGGSFYRPVQTVLPLGRQTDTFAGATPEDRCE